MNRNFISAIFILSLMGCAAALDVENGVEMMPGEAAAERLFERGFGEPWVGGNPPSFGSSGYGYFDYPSRFWAWGYDPFSYYSYQGKTYHRYLYSYPFYPGYGWYPYTYHHNWYPSTWHSGYRWP